MFNRNRYNNSRFNIPAIPDDSFKIQLYFNDSIKNATETAVEISDIYNFNTFLKSDCLITPGMPFIMTVKEELKGESDMIIGIINITEFATSLKGESDAAKKMYEKFDFKDEYKLQAWAGKDINIPAILLEDKVKNSTDGALEIITKNYFTEIISGTVAGNITEYENVIINVELKPGEELEINSDLYTAYIGDTNVLDAHSGHWVHLDADTRQLIIDTGNGGEIEGKLLYREGWL